MIVLRLGGRQVEGVDARALEARFPQYDLVRQLERASILMFMERNAVCLTGRVLDFGAGTQPYRGLVRGEYVPFEAGDRLEDLGAGTFDCVMCNQVVQFIQDVPGMLRRFHDVLRPGGTVVMTYPTCWDEVEAEDLHRFTKAGMTALLGDAGFKVLAHERRAQVSYGLFNFPLGHGVVAKKHAA